MIQCVIQHDKNSMWNSDLFYDDFWYNHLNLFLLWVLCNVSYFIRFLHGVLLLNSRKIPYRVCGRIKDMKDYVAWWWLLRIRSLYINFNIKPDDCIKLGLLLLVLVIHNCTLLVSVKLCLLKLQNISVLNLPICTTDDFINQTCFTDLHKNMNSIVLHKISSLSQLCNETHSKEKRNHIVIWTGYAYNDTKSLKFIIFVSV